MPRIEIECEYDCPHCHAGWVLGDDGIYTDDIEDQCTTTCGECGGVFQLRCVSVDVKMEATKVPSGDLVDCRKSIEFFECDECGGPMRPDQGNVLMKCQSCGYVLASG